jgi:hypothetical protein
LSLEAIKSGDYDALHLEPCAGITSLDAENDLEADSWK